jgi:hypothetical protein
MNFWSAWRQVSQRRQQLDFSLGFHAKQSGGAVRTEVLPPVRVSAILADYRRVSLKFMQLAFRPAVTLVETMIPASETKKDRLQNPGVYSFET